MIRVYLSSLPFQSGAEGEGTAFAIFYKYMIIVQVYDDRVRQYFYCCFFLQQGGHNEKGVA